MALIKYITIRTKLMLWAGFAVLMFAAMGAYSVSLSRSYMEDSYGKTMISLAQAMLNELSGSILLKVELEQILGTDISFRSALEESNERFGRMPDTKERLWDNDRLWRQVPTNETSSFMRTLLKNKLSQELAEEFIDFYRRKFGYNVFESVLVTNIHGALIAATTRTEGYCQANEHWWQETMENSYHVGDVAYYPDLSTYGLVVASQVKTPNGKVLGVIKALLSARWIMREAALSTHRRKTTELRLTTKDGRLLYDTRPFSFGLEMEEKDFFKHFVEARKTLGNAGHFIITEGGRQKLYAYAVSSEHKPLGDKGWVLFMAHDVKEVMQPVFRLRNTLGFACVLAVLAFLASAVFISRSLSKPLGAVYDAALAVARGDLSKRIEVGARDEIGELAAAFNRMTAKVEHSHAKLEHEVEKRALVQARLTSRTQELQKQTTELERSNQELQDFAYIASHDMQEPLRKIIAFGERLQTKEVNNLSPRGQDYVRRMQNAASRMSLLIQDLLQFSRVTTQAKPFETTDLGKILLEVIMDLEELIKRSKAQVDVGNMPALEADPMQMRQLFQNLLGNGLKFQEKDAIPVVSVSSRVADEYCEILFKDNGIGFDEKYLDRVFKPFQRLHGKGAYEGSGIGMAICNKIVQRHSGSLNAKSEPGKGATFTVTLPLKQNKTSEV